MRPGGRARPYVTSTRQSDRHDLHTGVTNPLLMECSECREGMHTCMYMTWIRVGRAHADGGGGDREIDVKDKDKE